MLLENSCTSDNEYRCPNIAAQLKKPAGKCRRAS
jgi:hypothetical protein